MTQTEINRNPQNGKRLHALMGKIGVAMLIQLILFSVLNSIAAVVELEMEYLEVSERTVFLISEILYMIAYVASFLIPTLILRCMLRKARLAQQMLLARPSLRLAPLLIVGAIALNFAAAYMNSQLVTLLLPFPNFDFAVTQRDGADELIEVVFALIGTAVIPAVVEELLIRGAVLTAMLPFGRTAAIIGSAFLFGLMHGNILQILYTTLMGIVLGWIYVRTKSLWCCMLIHFFNNAISVIQETLPNILEPEAAIRVGGAIELVVMIAGVCAIALLLVARAKEARPEDHGSFGVTFDPEADWTPYPMEGRTRIKSFFTPSVIVYTVLSGISMLATFFALMVGG